MIDIRHVLFIDDDDEFAETFIDEARNEPYFIKVDHRTNFKDMKSALDNSEGKYCAVVLDINCLMDEEQDIPSEDFIHEAVTYLKSERKDLCRFIFSEDKDKISETSRYMKTEKIFSKNDTEREALFKEIVKIDTEQVRIRSLYQEIFNIFELELADNELEEGFYNLIQNKDSKNLVQIANNLANIRRIQEGIHKHLSKLRPDILPESLISTESSFSDRNNHLAGKQRDENGKIIVRKIVFQEKLIEQLSNTIYYISSKHGNHKSNANLKYLPTNHTVNSLFFGLCEQLLWYKQIIDM